METESDRLASIQALGGQLVSAEAGPFWAIFDREYQESLDTSTRVPVLTARTSDAEQFIPRKGAAVTVAGKVYRVREHQPDGTGMTLVYLE
jgi:hypothetical protein